jgi:8-oxo-dGTP diphosphatase
VGVLVWKGDEILLVHRRGVHGDGTWSAPGGHLDPGETLEACAAREALEETGVEVTSVRFRAITNDVFRAEGLHYITVWMEGEWTAGDPAPLAEYELSKTRWFPRDELPGNLFPPLINLVRGRCYPEERGGLTDRRA